MGLLVREYGRGQGSDVRGLQGLGCQAEGWDPVYRPDAAKSLLRIATLSKVCNERGDCLQL